MSKPKLVPGTIAPDFDVFDVLGNHVKLSDYDRSPLLMVFLRYAGCPWCNLTIHRLTLEYPMLVKQGCKVIAFVQSDLDNIQQQIYGRHVPVPPFPIIADPQKKVYDTYGVGSSIQAAAKSWRRLPQWATAVKEHGFKQGKVDGDLFLVPASFLVAPHTQKLIRADYGASFYDFDALFGIYQSLIFNE